MYGVNWDEAWARELGVDILAMVGKCLCYLCFILS